VGGTNTHLRRAAWLCGDAEERGGGVDLLSSLLVCPGCRGDLERRAGEARCTGCGFVYEIADGIPVLRVERIGADAQKDVQASFFDEADPEFEVSRPHGTPWLYRWLLAEKFRRSLEALPLPAEGLTAATMCGGSGMDAEFLARVGASVISTDISLGAAQRTRERA